MTLSINIDKMSNIKSSFKSTKIISTHTLKQKFTTKVEIYFSAKTCGIVEIWKLLDTSIVSSFYNTLIIFFFICKFFKIIFVLSIIPIVALASQ